MKLNKLNRCFLLLSWILFFQVLRNISTIGYISCLGISLLLVFLHIPHNDKNSRQIFKFRNYSEMTFFICYSLLPLISLVNAMPLSDFFIALGRYLIMYSCFILMILCRDYLDDNYIESFYRAFCIFMGIAALSIIYQIFFGALPFLADSSSREGLERFASLAGSLTAYGTMGSFALSCLLFSDDNLFSKKANVILITLISLGLLISLQKAGVLNMIIVFGIYILSTMNIKNYKRIWNIVLLIIAGTLLFLLFRKTEMYEYLYNSIEYTFFSRGKVSTSNDLFSRLYEIPMEAYQKNNLNTVNLILGKGFTCMAGTVGLPSYTMAHNNFFTILYTGGIIYLISFLSLFLKKINLKKLFSFENTIMFLFLINMLIGGAEFFQPVTGIFIFSFLFINKE